MFMGFISCGDDDDKRIAGLEARIDSLQTANKSLQEELDAYKYSPAKLLSDIRQYYTQKDYFNVKENMYMFEKYHPEAQEYAEANKIYKKALKEEEAEEKRARAKMKPVERIMEKYDCSQDMAESILKRQVKMGMTQDMARAAWGRPYDINRSVGSYGVHEQWCYSGGCYLYFEDGILTSWQN